MDSRTRTIAAVLLILLIAAAAAYWMLKDRYEPSPAASVQQPSSVPAPPAPPAPGGTPDGVASAAGPAATEPSDNAGNAGSGSRPEPAPDVATPSPDAPRNAAFAGAPGSGSTPADAGAERRLGELASAAASATQAAGGAVSELARLVPNAELKGRVGQIVLKFPDAAPCKGTHTTIHRDDTTKDITSFYGSKASELMPGAYVVVINNKPVSNVQVQSKDDTVVSVGVLKISAGKNTHIELLDADGKKQLTSGYGEQEWGLPPGKYFVKVAGSSEPVEIKAGEVTEF
jgi:hypothetical protein